MSPIRPGLALRVFTVAALTAAAAAVASGFAAYDLSSGGVDPTAPTPISSARAAQAALELSRADAAVHAALSEAQDALTIPAFKALREATVAAEGVAKLMAEAQDGGPTSPAAARAVTAFDATSNRIDARLATIGGGAEDGAAATADAAQRRLRDAVTALYSVDVAALYATLQATEARFALTPSAATRQAFNRVASTLLAAAQQTPRPEALHNELADALSAVSRGFDARAERSLALSRLGAEAAALLQQAGAATDAVTREASAGLNATATLGPTPVDGRDATPALAALALSLVLCAAAIGAAWASRGDFIDDQDVANEDIDEAEEEPDDEEDFDEPRLAAPLGEDDAPADFEPSAVEEAISVEDAGAIIGELNADDAAPARATSPFAPPTAGAIPPPQTGGPYAPVPVALSESEDDEDPMARALRGVLTGAAPVSGRLADDGEKVAAAAPVAFGEMFAAPPEPPLSARMKDDADAAITAVIEQVLADEAAPAPPPASEPMAAPESPPAPQAAPLLTPKTGRRRTAAELAARAMKKRPPGA